MKSKFFIAAAIAASLSTGAFASDFSYSYAEITGGEVQIDGGNGTAKSVTGKFSVELGDNFFAIATANRSKYDVFMIDMNTNLQQIGFGYHGGLSKSTDFYVTGSVRQTETNVSFQNFRMKQEETGYLVDLGVRHAIDEYFEIGGNFTRTRQNGFYSSIFTVSGLAHVSRSLDVVLEAQDLDGANAYSAGIRYNF